MTTSSKLKRKREHNSSSPAPARQPSSHLRWRTGSHENSYSVKLIEALRRLRRSSTSSSEPTRSRAVREAADRALAVAARGRTRWSRAILASRSLKLKARKPPRRHTAALARPPEKMSKSKSPAMETKARVLGRLVPGCRKLSLSTLLEETSDYIPALEMQVRALTAIVQLLSAAGNAAAGERGAGEG